MRVGVGIVTTGSLRGAVLATAPRAGTNPKAG
jgi:hypothetical protein